MLRIARRARDRLPFLLSLPERSARAVVAIVAGTFKTAADHLLPRALRASHSYAAVVGRFERFLVETLGGVRGVYEDAGPRGSQLLVRKTAGNVLEAASFAALGVSPVWFLAMAADLSHGTRSFLEALVAELRREGLPVGEGSIQTVDGLLDALQRALGTGAGAADLPPLDLAGLRQTWETFKSSREPLPESAALAALFRDLQRTAAETGRSLLSVSSLSGLGTLAGETAGGAAKTTRSAGRAAARLFSATVVEDYRRTLAEIRAEGPEIYAARVVMPYIAAVRRHFDPRLETFTERRLHRHLPQDPPSPDLSMQDPPSQEPPSQDLSS
jgi:hypothetical protein